MDVCSPKNGFVVDIVVKQGDPIKKGDVLLKMDTICEDRDEAKLETMEHVRMITASQYEPPDADILKTIAKAAVDIADAKLQEVDHGLAYATLGVKLAR